MGSKGDIDIGGGGGGEPRDDYSPMSLVLSTDFPVFVDGAGEIEELFTVDDPGPPFHPQNIFHDGTYYYFQSIYVFNTFPGTDGFFGFSDDSHYVFEQRQTALIDVTVLGDWYVDYSTNRVYSYDGGSPSNGSYVHMCEEDITYIGGGVYSFHYGSTITFTEFDGTTLGVANTLGAQAPVGGASVGFLGANKILMGTELRIGTIWPGTGVPYIVRSLDGGATWAITASNRQMSSFFGAIPCPKGDPERLYFYYAPPATVGSLYYTSDLINLFPVGSSPTWPASVAPTWKNPPGNGDFAELRISGGGSPDPSGSRTYYIYEWDTGSSSLVKTMPAGSWFHGGHDINEIDTLQFEVEGVGWFDAYVMCSRAGYGNLSHNWQNTSWKARLYYWIPAAFDDGVGWSADNDPDFADFEDIVVFSEIEGGGVAMMARFNANGAYNGTWPPVAKEQPLEYYFKMYVSQDLGQSYTHVATLDQFPDGSPINRAYDTTFGVPNNQRYKHSKLIKVTDPVTGSPGYVVHGLQSQGFDGEYPSAESTVWFFSIDGQWRFLENQIDFINWSNPSQPDRFNLNSPQRTDTTGLRDENLSYPGAYFMGWPYHGGLHWTGSKLKVVGPTSGSQEYYRILDYDPPSFEYYTEDLIVASSAGFTIRAPHINELRQKLLHLNANVQTGGTNHVMFGIDVSDLVTVAANKTSVRAEHYSICKREHDKVAGQVGADPGTAFYTTGDSPTDIMSLAETPVADGMTAPSIRTLIAMRKVLQGLYSDGWFCACYSYCPCQTFVDIEISGGKK